MGVGEEIKGHPLGVRVSVADRRTVRGCCVCWYFATAARSRLISSIPVIPKTLFAGFHAIGVHWTLEFGEEGVRREGDGRFDGGNDRVLEITGGFPHIPGYREDRYPLGLD